MLGLGSAYVSSLNASIYLYNPETGNIYVNGGANNLGSDGFVNAMGHEMVHSVDSNTDPADRENFAKVVGEGTWDALDNGLYMSRADYGMETTTYNPNFADNVVMTLNSYKAGMIAESDKENLSGVSGPYGWGGVDYTKTTQEERAAIQRGIVSGAVTGVIAAGAVVTTPAIITGLTSAYYATGTVAYTATQTINNYYGKLADKADALYYKVGTELSSSSPNIINASYAVEEFSRGYFGPPTGTPSNSQWKTMGGLTRGLVNQYSDLLLDFKKLEESVTKEKTER